MKFSLIILALCVALVTAVAGCGGSSDSSTESSASTEAGGSSTTSGESSEESGESVPTASPDKKKTKPTVTVPKGISPKKYAFKEIEEGTGPEAKAGDKVTVQYVGVGYDSEEEFDSSWSRNEPFTFTLGAGEVIKGWDQGVEGMKVGGRRELLLPPELAYGSAGSPPSIGPNETLIFTIDLLSVE
jgi:FKBP-type peptidyl-prolyl cis-trans isomerase